jgi:transposase
MGSAPNSNSRVAKTINEAVQTVIELVQNGMSFSRAATAVCIHSKTAQKWVSKSQREGKTLL